MGKRKVEGIAAAGILTAVMMISILLPAKALFTGDGYLELYVGNPNVHKMLLEIAVLLLGIGGLLFLKIDGRIRLLMTAAVMLLFCWLHVVFLPMLISGIYLGILLLTGCFLRKTIFRMERFGGWPADFILGCSFMITFFCILSAVGISDVSVFRLCAAGLGILMFVLYLLKLRSEGGSLRAILNDAGEKLESFTPEMRLGLAFLLVMLLIQAGRVNLALDFDTLWYGVRSEYILTCGDGIYDDPGMVSMVYVYSKGWEILTLPLCDLPSHSYLIFFHVWLAGLGIMETGRLARFFMDEKGGFAAMVLTASIPGIMNMAVSAKTDMITWLMQLIMMDFFFSYVKRTEAKKERPVALLILTAGAYLISLTMKPTSLVFSTAVFGMMGIYLLLSRSLAVRASVRHWCGLFFPAAALTAVWARTYLITGMPVTSVFTSIFEKLGFTMKYPFASSPLPANYEEAEPALQMFFRRLYQVLLSPEGDDMGHIVIAWGSSLFLFLAVFLLLCIWGPPLLRRKKNEYVCGSVKRAARLIFWPFLAVNLISLMMLYQIDGNYFMLLYSMVILAGCRCFSELKRSAGRRLAIRCTMPILCFNLMICSITNWAWSCGFTPIQVKNPGYVDHEAQSRVWFDYRGVKEIWNFLALDRENRVISFGEHPFCLQFPCVVQSYKDVTAPWGNVELVNTPEAFEQYMEYSGTDYVYAQAHYLGDENWAWSYQLLRDLIRRGSLTDCVYEWGNFLGRRAETPVAPEQAAENLRIFDEQYWTYIFMEEAAARMAQTSAPAAK